MGKGARIGERHYDPGRLVAPALSVEDGCLAGQGRRVGRLILQDLVIDLQRFVEALLLDHDDGEIDAGL